MPYVYVLVALAVLDGVWLKIASAPFYKVQLAHLFAEKFVVWPVVLFYPLYALAIYVLVVAPALKYGSSVGLVLCYGVVLGLAAYGAYDLTNQATLKHWPLVVTVVDVLWGTVVTAAAAGLAVLIARTVHIP